jgi:7,8-didemethyl-8-hydroxy-5-deazariboflavin synthase CofH subunit
MSIDALLRDIDSSIASILNKALSGRDISSEDAVKLFNTNGAELLVLAMVANELRRMKIGDVVTFVINRNINFTNECIVRCGFCAYSVNVGSPNAYIMPIDVVVKKAKEAYLLGATEVCIQGAINPKINGEYYIEMCKAIRREIPEIHIHAFSPMEIAYGAKTLNLSIKEYLKALKEAGLNSIPGTAAEILSSKVREVICPRKISVEEWINIVKTAHKLNIPTTSTIMYGHVETVEDIVNHLSIIREIQKETGGFTEFIPLGFIHYNTEIYRSGLAKPGPTGIEDLKVHAISRIYLNNYIKNIQVSWVKLGPKYAQFLLNAGANDIGGTLMEENISRAAGATSGQYIAPSEMVRMIREAGRIPAQRDTLYNILKLINS